MTARHEAETTPQTAVRRLKFKQRQRCKKKKCLNDSTETK